MLIKKKVKIKVVIAEMLILLSWIGSQDSGMIRIVGRSSHPFVNVVAHLLPTPLWHPQSLLKVAVHQTGKNFTLR